MSGSERPGLSPVKQALVEIRRLKDELARERGRRSEPVAIVGIGVRFPGGADTTERFWELLRTGTNAVGPLPADRWDHDEYFDAAGEKPNSYYVHHGGFLDGVDRFDPEFFGIAPLEAETMDPQQRLMLETAWEALEDAGIAAGGLHGSSTGVFVGIGTADYQRLVMTHAERVDAYASSGTAFSVAAGRISYLLGLHGPALSIDTACSSSLVAVHLACASLRNGESSLALAGGVNLMLAPETTVDFCSAGMLSRDGRCKTFAADADGYVRSEGCGVVVLKRLSDAARDGDRVLAVIRGSAVNQDGRSSGLTAPNGPAQEAVLRSALADAGLSPADIQYVEAHGTGTSLGDPIEVQALGAVFGAQPRETPLLIGSVKTNLGHLEAAAGMAGLIKAVEAVRRGVIPAHLHFAAPNPHIAWDSYPLAVPVRETPFPTDATPRAGISSFGFSGTNAHVIIEAPPTAAVERGTERAVNILTLSAPQESGLRALAETYAAHLRQSRDSFADICATANIGRTSFTHRIAVVARDAAEAAARLDTWLEHGQTEGVWHGSAKPRGTVAALDALNGLQDALRAGAATSTDAGSDVLASLAQMFVAGAQPDWRAVHGTFARVTLPAYPFQRRPFWFTKRTVPAAAGSVTIRTVPDDPTASWNAAIAAGTERAALAPIDVRIADYAAVWSALEELTNAVGHNTLVELGAFNGAAGERSTADVMSAAGIDRLYTPIVQRWLDAMVQSGALERGYAGYSASAIDAIDTYGPWTRVRALLANDPALLRYLEHTVPLVPDVLRGRVSPLETLFPDGSFEMASELYEKSAVLRYVNGIAASALRAFVSARGANRAVRVLEVGAGTGGTTASLVHFLPPDRSTYVYTDVSSIFLDFGRTKFADTPFLETATLDIERDPAQQGFGAGTFDVMIGSNVMHAARDLRAALGHARSLLAPGGMMLLVESTGHHAWHDISTGLIEGWQHFDDDLRAETPLLPVATWLRVLRECGFADVAALPSDDSPAAALKQNVIVASAGIGTAAAATLPLASSDVRTGTADARTPALETRPAADRATAGAAATGGSEFIEQLRSAIGSEHEDIAAAAVRDCVMEVLRSDASRPPARDARLMDLGLDSLMAVRLRNLIQKKLGLPKKLPATLAFDYPTIRQIAALVVTNALTDANGAQRMSAAAAEFASGDDPEREAAVAAMSEAEVEAMLERLHMEGPQ